MPIFDKFKMILLSNGDAENLSKSVLNKDLSVVNFDSQLNVFYITLDKILFTNPFTTIEKVLDANGFVTNLENILSCLDSFTFSVHARVSENNKAEPAEKIHDYLPCISFELPRKNRVGGVLQRFYDEIASYEVGQNSTAHTIEMLERDAKIVSLKRELDKLGKENEKLNFRIQDLTASLLAEKDKYRQQDSNDSAEASLPGNSRLCRVEHVDLKKRLVKVKSFRKLFDIPTHMLDRVPEFKSLCLVSLDQDEKTPLGILFFDDKELARIEKRIADLLVVDGDTFKARDSMRNVFQIKAVNELEADSIRQLQRGMKVLISIVDNYIVRFSVIDAIQDTRFKSSVLEQLTVYEIGRNQLMFQQDDIDE
jgi:C4-type Zn-finger protein